MEEAQATALNAAAAAAAARDGSSSSSSRSASSSSSPQLVPLIVRGDWSWQAGAPITITNPHDNSRVAQVPKIDPRELGEAVAWAAERVDALARWPVADRIDCMAGWAQRLVHHKEEIASLETREMGKPIRQTRKIIDMVVTRIGLLCEARKNLQGEFYASEGNRATQRAHAVSVREPFGVTAGILPFNSPVSAMVWKIAPALRMGNSAVIKLSEHAPVAALAAAQLLSIIPMPAGALQVVHGVGSELGPVLSQHPSIAKISFTGSTAAGVDVFQRGASNFKRLTLECGSNDAAVILRDADLALAAGVVANLGMRTYSGQICTAPKRCIVAKEIYNGFEKLLAGEASRIVAGDPMDERTELGPLVNQAAAEQVERQVNEAVAAGARVVTGGRRNGAFFPPTILADVSSENPIFHEGAFGPVVCLIRAADEDEAVELANRSRYALRAAVFGRDLQRAAAVARRLDVSGVAVNGPALVDNPRLNVEPRKMSGIGAEGILASLLEYSQPKFIWINDWWPDAAAAAAEAARA
jgi:acyl-CoA reductase-like NAD-dependent aldehyde dehydrogenase